MMKIVIGFAGQNEENLNVWDIWIHMAFRIVRCHDQFFDVESVEMGMFHLPSHLCAMFLLS